LINGPVVADAVKDPTNRLARLASTEKNDEKLVEGVFLSILCRKPTPKEMAAGLKAMRTYEEEYARVTADQAKLMEALAAAEKSLPARKAEWEKPAKIEPLWTVLEPASAVSAGGATLTKQADGSLLVGGPNPSPEKYTITAPTKLTGITAIRL